MDKAITRVFLKNASQILGDTEKGLSGREIVDILMAFASDYNVGKLPHSSYPFDASNKRTALLENLSVFSPKQQYEIIKKLCDHSKFSDIGNKEVGKLKAELISQYGHLSNKEDYFSLKQDLINEVRTFLSDYPKSEKLYLDAMEKFSNNIYPRNLLDDLRLSLELLLKEIFQNKKSLENQMSEIGGLIKSKGGSKQFTNMFKALVNYYSNYQNNLIKHNDAIIEDEIEFIFEMTSSFMKHIIKMRSI